MCRNGVILAGPRNYEVWGGAKKWDLLFKKKKKKHWKITLHTVSATKLLIKLLYLIFSTKYCSIDNMTNLFNLSCDIVDLASKIFIILTLKNFFQQMQL